MAARKKCFSFLLNETDTLESSKSLTMLIKVAQYIAESYSNPGISHSVTTLPSIVWCFSYSEWYGEIIWKVEMWQILANIIIILLVSWKGTRGLLNSILKLVLWKEKAQKEP